MSDGASNRSDLRKLFDVGVGPSGLSDGLSQGCRTVRETTLETTALAPTGLAALGALDDLLGRWDHAGLASGHAWAPCDQCGEATMRPRTAAAIECRMTAGCKGKHRVAAGRPTPLAALRSGLVTVDDVIRHPPELGVHLRAALLAGNAKEGGAPNGTPPSGGTDLRKD